MEKTLIIGYGNPDRQDDGAAWHILNELATSFGRKLPHSYEEEFISSGESPELLFMLQLTPELAEALELYDRVCFVDVHTSSIPKKLQQKTIHPVMTLSPLTHHMTPETLLALTFQMYNRVPDAILISIRGYEFGFEQLLSEPTRQLVKDAVDRILTWLHQE